MYLLEFVVFHYIRPLTGFSYTFLYVCVLRYIFVYINAFMCVFYMNEGIYCTCTSICIHASIFISLIYVLFIFSYNFSLHVCPVIPLSSSPPHPFPQVTSHIFSYLQYLLLCYCCLPHCLPPCLSMCSVLLVGSLSGLCTLR